MSKVMLSTTDNPYDPFTEFDNWFTFDEAKGYHSCAYLARVSTTSTELSEEDYDLAIEEAIDSIVDLDIINKYIKVTKETFNSRKQRSIAKYRNI